MHQMEENYQTDKKNLSLNVKEMQEKADSFQNELKEMKAYSQTLQDSVIKKENRIEELQNELFQITSQKEMYLCD